MSGATATSGRPGPCRTAWSCLTGSIVAAVRGLAFFVLMLAGTGPLMAVVLLLALIVNRIGPNHPLNTQVASQLLVLTACTVPLTRWLTGLTRRLAGRWCGVPIAAPYRPPPGREELGLWLELRRRLRWLLTDPATWRDLLWLAVDTCGGWILAAGPAALVLYGLLGGVLPALGLQALPRTPDLGFNLAILTMKGHGAFPLGVVLAAAGLCVAPRLLRAYGGLARLMLAPTLAPQVAHLAQTRSDAIDTGAAEMRRIERDLHDGAQARLVAMGMTLDAAGQLIDDDTAAARALLPEARDSSAKALPSCGTWSAASTRRYWPTGAWPTRSPHLPWMPRCECSWPESCRPPAGAGGVGCLFRGQRAAGECVQARRRQQGLDRYPARARGCCRSASPTAVPAAATPAAALAWPGSSGASRRSTACSPCPARRAGPPW